MIGIYELFKSKFHSNHFPFWSSFKCKCLNKNNCEDNLDLYLRINRDNRTLKTNYQSSDLDR